jgi:putative transcriptional regulator
MRGPLIRRSGPVPRAIQLLPSRGVLVEPRTDAARGDAPASGPEFPARAPNLCESLEIEWCGSPDEAIDWGGPVDPQTGWVIFDDDEHIEASEAVTQIGEGVHFAGSLEVLRQVASDPPGHLRVLLGYAGWGPGQLEAELSEGAWLVVPVTSEVVFEVDRAAMWEHVVRSLGIEPATLVATRGVH